VVVIVWWLELPIQSVPITTNVLHLNPDHGEVYSIQLYVINCVSDLLYVGGFLRVLLFPSRIQETCTYDIAGILLKEALTKCKNIM
jgi:hypothetical protein